MRLASFITKTGKSFGLVTDDGVIDLGRRLRPRFNDIKSLLAADGLARARDFADSAPDHALDDLIFLPTIESPGKIFCVGMNYAEKRKEFGETSAAPTLFIRFPDSQTGHRRPVLKPRLSDEFDYEGELAVIIGTGGAAIEPGHALSHVGGYSCYMDGSVRDWQHSWFTAGKNWRQTGAFGPWLVTADEIPDPHVLTLRTYLNGVTVQNDSTANMVHRIPNLIAYISTFSALSPGDVIITGSPGGVGKKRNPPLFLKEGDVVEVEIERIGRLENVVLRDAAVA
ncbi:MAG: fumarylacetoacetate hydrolase family protein [Telmatospirillum sp.]|nr:fumarylacetoacetate hydrolase family protein [Telmatospirillum sp.]